MPHESNRTKAIQLLQSFLIFEELFPDNEIKDVDNIFNFLDNEYGLRLDFTYLAFLLLQLI